MSEDLIRIEAKFSKQFYPKFDEHVEDGDFAIISWEVISVEEGTPKLNPNFNTVTVKGSVSEFSRLETYTIIAREAPNDFGMQYDLVYMGQPADMSNINVQKSFLKRILTEGQFEEIFATLDDPMGAIKSHDVDKLSTVKGIGKTTAEGIIKRYEDNKDLSKIYVELDGYGITNRMMQKLLERYGNPDTVISRVKTNPYQLASEVNGIGFKKADQIALENGLEWDNPDRVKGFISHRLEEKAESGDSYIYADDLMYLIDTELGDIGADIIGKSVKEMVADNVLGLTEPEGNRHKRVYLTRYFNLEQKITDELKRILKGENNFVTGKWREDVNEMERLQGWRHTDEQIEGIERAIGNQVCVVSGLAGSGKTSVVTAMLKALEGYSFAQTALSGRASAKLQEVTGAKGQTIHRLLGYNPAEGFKHNSENKLPFDIIILDEISLVGGEIFLSLVRAIKDGAKLIILGDDGQLESIGCMNLARDLIMSETIPSIELTKIHRQAARSGIITEASKIREHEQLFSSDFRGISKRGELKDFELNVVNESSETRPTMVNYFREWLPKVEDVMDIQLLVPVNERGDASVSNINQDIQQIYNPPHKNKSEIEVVINKTEGKKFIIRESDKVMVMKNNYQTKNDFGVDTPIFNGWIGIVKSIYGGKAIVYFPMIDDEVVLPGTILKDVSLGYACSVHKYQGSQSKVIIGGIDYSTPPFMRTKELVYTLVTRAEEYCVLVTQNPALRDAINTSGVVGKNTFLREMLDGE